MTEQVTTVVCGIDDSPGARAALVEAVRFAGRRGARVRALLQSAREIVEPVLVPAPAPAAETSHGAAATELATPVPVGPMA
jgi:nucleotide-binding universal stress UspA family protein